MTTPNQQRQTLHEVLDGTISVVQETLSAHRSELRVEEMGRVSFVGHGTARAEGLPGVQSQELVRFSSGRMGMAFNLDPNEVGIVLLDEAKGLRAGSAVHRTHRVLDVPVGEALLGRVIDAVGRPMDGLGALHAARRLAVERPSAAIMDRAPVTVPLQTGIKVVDALIPVGRGQRELILGDRQTGKTALALDCIINQKDKGVLCIYCAIGQRRSSVARVVDNLNRHHARDYTAVIVTTEDDPAGRQFIAPYAAMSIGEHFMQHGRDVLIVFDDLTRHARAYRELSLLLRRPPGREAYPGDIFYIHSRLLERSTHLREELGGGSLTALPIVETEAENLAAYIPTNLISITDGQIYLSPRLFDKGVLPPVDVGKSVSRVGGKTQLPAYRVVAGDLRLSYAQFEELESFARFGTRLDEETRKALERGRRVREILKQRQYEPIAVFEQVATLVALNGGAFDDIPLSQISDLEQDFQANVRERLATLGDRIEDGAELTPLESATILKMAYETIRKKN